MDAQAKAHAADDMMWGGSLHSGTIGTFMNYPRVAPDADQLRAAGATVGVIGFPWDSTCISRPGASMGPRSIREASEQFIPYNASTGVDLNKAFRIVDCGDIAVLPGNSPVTQARAEAAVSQILKAEAMALILGGDHSITIGPARAFAKKFARAGMIHFDTHYDTAEDVGGDKLSHCCPIARAVDAGINPKKIVSIGPSGWLNPASEYEYTRKKGITTFTLENVWEMGTAPIIQRVREVMSEEVDAIYLTIDIDVLDAAYAPGTGVPTPGGLTSREMIEFIRGFRGLPIRTMDIAEVSPPWDMPSGTTARLGARLVVETLASVSTSINR